MRRHLLLPAGLAFLAACASAPSPPPDDVPHFTGADSAAAPPAHAWTPEQAARVSRAIQRADSIVTDPVYVSILRDLEARRRISWPGRTRSLLPSTADARPTSWMLDRFAREGNYGMDDIGGRNFPDPRTTASTAPCVPFQAGCKLETDLGITYVDSATVEEIANTLIHERVHSFGQEHAWGQQRRFNLCDAPYVMGDLAEMLLLHRDTGQPVAPRQKLCRALHKRLRADGIVS